MSDNKLDSQNKEREIYNSPESVAKGSPQDIIYYFEGCMNNQQKLSEKVNEVAPLLTEEKLIDIIKTCSKRSENRGTGYKRLCGTFFVWLTKEKEEKLSLETWIQRIFHTKKAT